MKLRDTHICINCEEVYGGRAGKCPACGSKHTFPLSKWLNRNGKEANCKHLRRVVIGINSLGRWENCVDCMTTLLRPVQDKRKRGYAQV
jgi:ribosomal protein L40E